MASGVDGYVSKPISFEALKLEIQGLLASTPLSKHPAQRVAPDSVSVAQSSS
jgi:DNA-binding response OmpR family regulator